MTGRWWLRFTVFTVGLVGCHADRPASDPPAGEHAGAEAGATSEEAHVTVQVEPARLGNVSQTVQGLGRCEAIPERLATLTPAVEGHVHALMVKQGEAVHKGQVIVVLDKAVALADLAEKTATRDGLQAALALLKAVPRPEERRGNELAIEQARLAVDRARRLAARIRPLLGRNEVSEQQVFDADLAVSQAQLQEQAAQAQLQVLLIGPKPEAIAEAEAKVKTAQGAVEFSQAHLDYHEIHSPIDGVLDSLTCHPGQTIAVGTPVGEVVDTAEVLALVYLPAATAQAVRGGQPATVRAEGSRTEGTTGEPPVLAGKVEFVGRIADPQTGSLPVHVLVQNAQGLLTVGQSVDVGITVDQRAGVLEVASRALIDLGEGPLLTVVRDGKTKILHPEVGTVHEGWVAITGTDLKAEEPVIVDGGYNLPEDTPVKVELPHQPEAEKAPEKTEDHDKPETKSPAATEPHQAVHP